MSVFLAEFFGTFLLILLGNGVVANVLLDKTKGFDMGFFSITTAWALAVFVGVSVAGPYSGAHLNPAITLGFAIVGKFSWMLVLEYVSAQILGAMFGAFMVWLFYKQHYSVTKEIALKKATFFTIPNIRNNTSNFLSELIGTFVLVFVVFYFTSPEFITIESTKVNFGLGSLGAIPVSFLVWVIGLGLGGTTGYAINPARDLGPRVTFALLFFKKKETANWDYAWIPIVGPIAGATTAAMLYLLMNFS